MEWIETTGVTLDEAKERALDRLGVAEDELDVEVLVEASRSMFGLKKTEARLRARVRPTSPRPNASLYSGSSFGFGRENRTYHFPRSPRVHRNCETSPESCLAWGLFTTCRLVKLWTHFESSRK